VSSDGTTTPGVGLPRRRLDDLPGLQAEDGDVLRGEPGDEPASEPEPPGVLQRSVELRFPDLSEIENPRDRTEALQDHIVATAIMRGELAALRLAAHTQLQVALKDWNRTPTTGRTGPQREDERRRLRGDLAALIDDAKFTIARCTEEMDRLGGTDYDAASRVYTLLSGG
jgi:hypothetical protein